MYVVLVALLVAAGRVLDFCRAHSMEVPVVASLVEQLTTLTARAHALASQKESGLGLREWATSQRERLDRRIRYHLLRPVALWAQVIFRADPVKAAQFNVPRRDTDKPAEFLVLAQTVLTNLQAHVAAFAAVGMNPGLPDQLAKALAEYAALPDTGYGGVRAAGLARKGMEEVADAIMDVLKALDAIHRVQLQDDPTLMAQWREARKIPWPNARKKTPTAKPTTPPTGQSGNA